MSGRLPVCFAVFVSGLLAGCTDENAPKASFVYNEDHLSLVREAQRGFDAETADGEKQHVNGVDDYLTENFGSPIDLVAWLRLPVDYGGQAGVVSGDSEASKVRRIGVRFSNDVDSFGEPAELLWMSGEQAGETVMVSAYDAEADELQLSGVLEPAPADGTAFIINPGAGLKEGRRLYMTHCVHCHGTSGDGNGPTAKYLNPRPRDYRQGKFKFTSTKELEKISRKDLARVVKQGIPGTYMPSFMLLEDDELHAIVEYVRWLAMRGEYERKLCAELSGDYSREAISARVEGGEVENEIMTELRELLAADFPDSADAAANELKETWEASDTGDAIVVPKVPRVPDTPESRAIGRQWFLSKQVNCANCHGPLGRGDGPQTEDYEEDPVTKRKLPDPGLHDDWGHIVKPRNLTRGIYRGGRRPIDIFCRVYAGIKGAKMPAFGGKINPPEGTDLGDRDRASWQDEQIWHIVNYVLSIPFEGRMPAPDEATEVARRD